MNSDIYIFFLASCKIGERGIHLLVRICCAAFKVLPTQLECCLYLVLVFTSNCPLNENRPVKLRAVFKRRTFYRWEFLFLLHVSTFLLYKFHALHGHVSFRKE